MKVTLQTHFDEQGHNEDWRNAVARDLNTLIGRAVFFAETSNDESDQAAEAATLRIVERVAEFEDITEAGTPGSTLADELAALQKEIDRVDWNARDPNNGPSRVPDRLIVGRLRDIHQLCQRGAFKAAWQLTDKGLQGNIPDGLWARMKNSVTKKSGRRKARAGKDKTTKP